MKRTIIFFVFLLSINFVSAFGVATLYSDNYPLKMAPGETRETFFLLRNIVEGDSDVSIKSELVMGQDVAVLIDGSRVYDVPFGAEVEVPVRIKIPDNAKPGDEYSVGAIFRPSAGKLVGGGNIEFIVNIGKSFPVVVVRESDKTREIVRLTVEDEGGRVGKFAPFVKGGRGIWLGIIFVLLIGIITILAVIIFILRNRNMAIRNLNVGQLANATNM